jgi:hypothetical protein
MCTVTYIPTNTGYFLCSNRDEHLNRPIALLPNYNVFEKTGIWYPIDGAAGGSWIGCKKDGNAAVLLNGAFEKHISHQPYKLSRGLIFVEILQNENLIDGFATIDLTNIEPFTLIIINNSILYECIWDGIQKFNTKLTSTEAQIWSSCTLYDTEIRTIRKAYFKDWLETKTPILNATAIREFHSSKPFSKLEYNFMMERLDGISTVSTTCIEVNTESAKIYYHNLKQDKFQVIQLERNSINY